MDLFVGERTHKLEIRPTLAPIHAQASANLRFRQV